MLYIQLLLVEFILVSIFFSPSVAKRIRKDGNPDARRFQVRNLSRVTIDIYWINLETEERVHQFTLVSGASESLNSHFLHEFEVREAPRENGECKNESGACRKRYFQITAEEDQIFTVDSEFRIDVSNSRTRAIEKAKDALKECRELYKKLYNAHDIDPMEHTDQVSECMKERIRKSIYFSQEEIDFQADIRRRMGDQLMNYACQDPNPHTTDPIWELAWNPNNKKLILDDDSHTLKVLMEADTTMVAIIENMIRPADCEYIQYFAQFNTEDPSQVSWDLRKEPPILDLLTRMYAYSGPAAKLMKLYGGMPEKGKPLFEIYHDSSSSAHSIRDHEIVDWPVNGPLFARLIMFCEVPDENGGGGIHFPESGVHIHPNVGDALFISYTKASESQRLNEKFSNKHIDCPVLGGNRTIIQHQYRLYPNELA